MRNERDEHTDDITIESESMEQEVRTKPKFEHMVPDFSLESVDGQIISPMDFKEKKNLVIVFFNPRSMNELEAMALLRQRYNEMAEENAEVLAVAPGPMEELRDCLSVLQLPFPLLHDSGGKVTDSYGVGEAAIFVTDRYGTLRMLASLGGDTDKVLDQAISTLDLAELECPECGVPTWPTFEE